MDICQASSIKILYVVANIPKSGWLVYIPVMAMAAYAVLIMLIL